MGYAFMYASCIACGIPFTFNPHKVPSIIVNGRREPICRNCANKWNELHPDKARPILDDAYEPIPEEEL